MRGFAIRASTPYAGADLQSVPPPLTLARICNPCLHPLRWRGFAIRASTPYAGADLQSVPPPLRWRGFAIRASILTLRGFAKRDYDGDPRGRYFRQKRLKHDKSCFPALFFKLLLKTSFRRTLKNKAGPRPMAGSAFSVWGGRWDSNPRPSEPQSDVLTN